MSNDEERFTPPKAGGGGKAAPKSQAPKADDKPGPKPPEPPVGPTESSEKLSLNQLADHFGHRDVMVPNGHSLANVHPSKHQGWKLANVRVRLRQKLGGHVHMDQPVLTKEEYQALLQECLDVKVG